MARLSIENGQHLNLQKIPEVIFLVWVFGNVQEKDNEFTTRANVCPHLQGINVNINPISRAHSCTGPLIMIIAFFNGKAGKLLVLTRLIWNVFQSCLYMKISVFLFSKNRTLNQKFVMDFKLFYIEHRSQSLNGTNLYKKGRKCNFFTVRKWKSW